MISIICDDYGGSVNVMTSKEEKRSGENAFRKEFRKGQAYRSSFGVLILAKYRKQSRSASS